MTSTTTDSRITLDLLLKQRDDEQYEKGYKVGFDDGFGEGRDEGRDGADDALAEAKAHGKDLERKARQAAAQLLQPGDHVKIAGTSTPRWKGKVATVRSRATGHSHNVLVALVETSRPRPDGFTGDFYWPVYDLERIAAPTETVLTKAVSLQIEEPKATPLDALDGPCVGDVVRAKIGTQTRFGNAVGGKYGTVTGIQPTLVERGGHGIHVDFGTDVALTSLSVKPADLIVEKPAHLAVQAGDEVWLKPGTSSYDGVDLGSEVMRVVGTTAELDDHTLEVRPLDGGQGCAVKPEAAIIVTPLKHIKHDATKRWNIKPADELRVGDVMVAPANIKTSDGGGVYWGAQVEVRVDSLRRSPSTDVSATALTGSKRYHQAVDGRSLLDEAEVKVGDTVRVVKSFMQGETEDWSPDRFDNDLAKHLLSEGLVGRVTNVETWAGKAGAYVVEYDSKVPNWHFNRIRVEKVRRVQP